MDHPFIQYCKLVHDFNYGHLENTIGIKKISLANGDKCCIFTFKERMVVIFYVRQDVKHWLVNGDCEHMNQLDLQGQNFGKVNTKIHEAFKELNHFVINIVAEYLNIGLRDFRPSLRLLNGKVRQRSIGSGEYKRITMFDFDQKDSLEIQEYITNNSFDTATCVFLGSNLGGGVAMISALNTALLYKCANIECYTFGCPKIGDCTFAKFARAEIPQMMCLTHQYDIVPDLPILRKYYSSRYISKVLIDVIKKYKKNSRLKLYLMYIFQFRLDFLLKYNDIRLYLKIILANYSANKKNFVVKWSGSAKH